MPYIYGYDIENINTYSHVRLALDHFYLLDPTRTQPFDTRSDSYSTSLVLIILSLLGVQTRVPYADGSTENFEYLDPFISYGHSDYFHTLVEAMVQAGGIRNVTIRGLPYDFRYAPTSTSGYV